MTGEPDEAADSRGWDASSQIDYQPPAQEVLLAGFGVAERREVGLEEAHQKTKERSRNRIAAFADSRS